jgi:hypothetical protein
VRTVTRFTQEVEIMTEVLSTERQQQMLQIMTTEQTILQGGRGSTISEANGRISSFLITVSSTLVALAFVGQISRLGATFYVFGLVLFPSVFFLGVFTFERVLQSAIEDVIYVREMNRIRHWYVELAPEVADYFLLSTYDDAAAVSFNLAVNPSKRWQYFQAYLTTAGMVAVVNSVLIGVFAGLVVGLVLGPRLAISAVVGIIIFLVSVFVHQGYQWARWMSSDQRLAVRFPSPSENSPP